MPRKQTFHLRCSRPRDETGLALFQEELRKMCTAWCAKYGYHPRGADWEVQERWLSPGPPMVELVLTVELEARWDGVWGDLRGALLDDGLLDPEDIAPPSWTPVVGVDPASDGSSGVVIRGHSMRITPLDPDGVPAGETVTIDESGTYKVSFGPLTTEFGRDDEPARIYAEAKKVDPWPEEFLETESHAPRHPSDRDEVPCVEGTEPVNLGDWDTTITDFRSDDRVLPSPYRWVRHD